MNTEKEKSYRVIVRDDIELKTKSLTVYSRKSLEEVYKGVENLIKGGKV